MVNIYLFSISLAFLVVLFFAKWIEERFKKKSFIGSLLSSFDSSVSKFFDTVHFRIYQVIQSVRYIIMVRIPEKSRVSYSGVVDTAGKEIQKGRDTMMGKRNLETGSVSFFLKKIKEDADKTPEGKIEDTL